MARLRVREFRHLISKLRQNFFFGRHEPLGLQKLLARTEIECERNRLPRCLQFAAHDADDPFKNLFFDFGDVTGIFAALAFPAEDHVDDRKGNGEIELENARGADRGEDRRMRGASPGGAPGTREMSDRLGGNAGRKSKTMRRIPPMAVVRLRAKFS